MVRFVKKKQYKLWWDSLKNQYKLWWDSLKNQYKLWWDSLKKTNINYGRIHQKTNINYGRIHQKTTLTYGRIRHKTTITYVIVKKMPWYFLFKSFEHRGILAITTVEFVAGYHMVNMVAFVDFLRWEIAFFCENSPNTWF